MLLASARDAKKTCIAIIIIISIISMVIVFIVIGNP